MIKLFLILCFSFSLVSNCENKNNKESSHQDNKEIHDNTEPNDSIFKQYETPPIVPIDKKFPPKQNDSI